MLDLAATLPGQVATMFLSQFGARVVRIDRPGGDLRARSLEPVFLGSNAGKESIALDLGSDRGREVLYRMVERADALLEGFRPGVAERLKIGHEMLRSINPALIYCSLSGCGQSGPYRSLPGHDINYVGLAGLLELTGERDRAPVVPGGSIADWSGALFAALGILLALVARSATGRGQYLDVALLDATVPWLSTHLARRGAQGIVPKRGETRLGGGYVPCYGVYPTGDGRFLAVGCLEPHLWRNLCMALGRPEWVEHQFDTGERGRAIMAELRELLCARTRDEWQAYFADHDTCVTPVKGLVETLADPQLASRSMFLNLIHPLAGLVLAPGVVVKMSDTPGSLGRAAPVIGADSHAILDELGYSGDEIAELRAAGAFAEPDARRP